MLAVDTVLHWPDRFAGVAVFSSTIIAQEDWDNTKGENLKDLPVIQSHGKSDELIPFDMGQKLNEYLSEKGMKVEFVPFHGGHTITLEVIDKFTSFLKSRL
jgi:phospholipase/carboxylesterase